VFRYSVSNHYPLLVQRYADDVFLLAHTFSMPCKAQDNNFSRMFIVQHPADGVSTGSLPRLLRRDFRRQPDSRHFSFSQ